MRNLVILGNTPFAERLYYYISFEGVDKVIAFTQEADYITNCRLHELPVLPFEELASRIDRDFEIILGIGYTRMNSLRRSLYDMCINNGYKIATYISTNAISYTKNIGIGCFIAPGCIIGPNCALGNGNYLGSSVVLSHDNVVGDFNFMSTNSVFGGYSKVGNNCFFGLHSTIKDNIEIADNNLIGSQTNVLKSIINTGGVFIGNPARQLVDRESDKITI